MRHNHDQALGPKDWETLNTRDSLLQCLLTATSKLQESDRSRYRLIARAVREVQDPLAAMEGFCGLLLDQQLGALNSVQLEIAEKIRRNLRKASRITASLAHLAGTNGKPEEPSPCDLEQLIARVLEEVAASVNDKAIHVEVSVTPPLVPVTMVSEQIELVLVTLLETAIQFSSPGATVEFRAYPYYSAGLPGPPGEAPNSLRIDVSDNGIPLSAAETGMIFDETAAYGGGQDRSVGGLGLAFCKLAVKFHAGRIWIESLEHRTTVSIVLPLC